MRKTLLPITAAIAAVIGLATAAQAQTTHPARLPTLTAGTGHDVAHAALTARRIIPSPGNPAVVTIYISDPCKPGQTESLSGVPPGMFVEIVDGQLALYGIPPSPPPSSYRVTVTCSGASVPPIPLRILRAPLPASLIGVGAATDGNLFDQADGGYNEHHAAAMYSFDATNPSTGAIGDTLTTKEGCPAIPRPNGSSAGIAALAENTTDPDDPGAYCIDFARSVDGRQPTDPPYAPGGVAFVTLARDAVTWATRDAASGGTNAPKTLTPAQLSDIYRCDITNWDQVGGANAPIHAFLPYSSETGAAFLTAIGVTQPGPCVSDDNSTLAENEGVNPVLDDPDAIVPYSISAYLAQAYHSAACLNEGCTHEPSEQACVPANGQDLFSCDQTGVLALNEIDHDLPFLPFHPPTPPCLECHINAAFPAEFQGTVYDVVRYDPTTADHIPAYLEPDFAAATADTPGWLCGKQGQAYLKDYGYLPAATCGTTS
jgi:hypothetical protein